MATLKRIKRFTATWANVVATLQTGFSAFLTDQTREMVMRQGNNYDAHTPDKYWNGSAWIYNDSHCDDATVDGNIFLGNGIYHIGDLGTGLEFNAGNIDFIAGNTYGINLSASVLYAANNFGFAGGNSSASPYFNIFADGSTGKGRMKMNLSVTTAGLTNGELWSSPNDSYNVKMVGASDVSPMKFTTEGGLALRVINDSGVSVKGHIMCASEGNNFAVTRCVEGDLDPLGIALQDGVAQGQEMYIVISGKADVMFNANGATRGDLARMSVSADTGNTDVAVAQSEAAPSNPSATDKHFQEIGHCLETRAGAGLAKCILHFN
jgi:hypothetical protein